MRRSVLPLAAAALLLACIPEEPAPDNTVAAPKQAASAPAADPGATPDSKSLLAAVDALKDKLSDRPRDFNVNLALGNLYYDNGRYIEALGFYRDALALADPAEKKLLSISAAAQGAREKDPRNKVVLARGAAKAEAPASCRLDKPSDQDVATGQKSRALESVAAAAKELESKGEKGSDECWEQLRPAIAGLHARRGNSWYLIGNADKAREDHDAALALDPDQPEALFFAGALTLEQAHGDPARLAEGKKLWARLLQVAPDHPRATLVKETLPRVDELFGAHANPMAGHPEVDGAQGGHDDAAPPMVAPEAMKAFQDTPHTPEMDKNLDDLTTKGEQLLADGKWQEALDTLKGVMPFRPDARVALGMGMALRELGKPTAERVLTQAARMPGADVAKARLELAKFYEKGDVNAAKAIYAEISGDPKWGAEAKARLAKLP